MLIILYGLAGSGKSFIGDLIAQHYPYYHWDADSALTEDMKIAIKNGAIFTPDMRNIFVTHLVAHIKSLQTSHANLVVSQGLYREQDRQYLRLNFPEAKFIRINADDKLIHERLILRNNEVTTQYAKKIQLYFQSNLEDSVIHNNSNFTSVLEQITGLNNLSHYFTR